MISHISRSTRTRFAFYGIELFLNFHSIYFKVYMKSAYRSSILITQFIKQKSRTQFLSYFPQHVPPVVLQDTVPVSCPRCSVLHLDLPLPADVAALDVCQRTTVRHGHQNCPKNNTVTKILSQFICYFNLHFCQSLILGK